MRFRREGGLGSSQYHQVHKFRRRFAKLLIAIGLIYIGAAVSAIGQIQPAQLPAQQFTIVPASNSHLLGGLSKNQPNAAVLGQTTNVSDNIPTTPVFIPQCSYQSIPYKTVYKTAPWLEAGQQISSGGWDGEQKICNNQFGPPTVNTIVSPLDKTITTGTKVLPEYSAENDPQIYNDKNGSPDYK
jgi:hypothetical protein